MKKQHVNLSNTREKKQLAVMRQIIKDGVCPFCIENLSKYHTKPILFQTDEWIVTQNAWPYEMTKKHFLVISQRHIEHSSEISRIGWREIGEVLDTLERSFGLDHGTMLMRFGDTNKTGATVKHLHFQLVQSDPNHPDYDPKKGLFTRIG